MKSVGLFYCDLLKNCYLLQFAKHLDSSSSKLIYIVTKEESFKKIMAILKLKGISVSTSSDSKLSEVKKR